MLNSAFIIITHSTCDLLPVALEMPLKEAFERFHAINSMECITSQNKVTYRLLYQINQETREYHGSYAFGLEYHHLFDSIEKAEDDLLKLYINQERLFLHRMGKEAYETELKEALEMKYKIIPMLKEYCRISFKVS